MALDISNFNIQTRIEKNLRDVAVNPHEMTQACFEIQNYLISPLSEIESSLGRASWLAQLGTLQRILLKLSDAEKSHKECLRLLLANPTTSDKVLAAQIRLAHVYQWQRRFELSNELFFETLGKLKSSANRLLLSFGWQHQGKNLFDQGLFKEALECFYEALRIREELQKSDLMESTELSIKITLEQISKA